MAQFTDNWRGGGIGRGAYSFYPSSVSQVPLTLRLLTGQVANGLEIKNALGTTIFSVSPTGNVEYTGSETITDALTVTGAANLLSTLAVGGTSTLTGALIANSTAIFNGETTFNAKMNFNSLLEFDSGSAITAGSHQIGRNGSDSLQYNVPLVRQHIFTVEDTAKMSISSTTFSVNNNSVFGGTMTINGALNVSGLATLSGGLNLDQLITWTAGEAITAGSYQIGRDADATNQLHFNVPTGASIEMSVNDVASFLLNANRTVFLGGQTSSHSIAGAGDLIVAQLEINSHSYFDTSSHYSDNVYVLLGNSDDAGFRFSTAQTANCLHCLVDNTSNSLLITQTGDTGYNFAHANQTNPTVFIHSANQSATQWLSLTHDATDGILGVGVGSLFLSGGLKYTRTAVAAATYTALSTDHILGVTYTATGTVAITLATAQVQAGKAYHIVDEGGNAATNNITISTEGAELINGQATYVINGNYNGVTVYSDGTNWFIY